MHEELSNERILITNIDAKIKCLVESNEWLVMKNVYIFLFDLIELIIYSERKTPDEDEIC